MAEEERIVVVGGGIIGCSTAYWISQLSPHTHITIIEMEGIASSSSGKAGGFLARGWHGGGVTRQLHEAGFDLIEEFAHKHSLQSYRKVPMYSLSHRRNPHSTGLPWLNNKKVSYTLDDDTTAQVTPKELTEAFLEHAGPNVQTKIGAKVVSVQTSPTDKRTVESVNVVSVESNTRETILCSVLIVCTGAWTSILPTWFQQQQQQQDIPRIRMEGIRSSSCVYQYPHSHEQSERRNKLSTQILQTPAVLFCGDDENGCHLEVYPRPNGDIYLCGLGGSPQLSGDQIKHLLPKDVTPNMNRVQLAHRGFMKMTSTVEDNPGTGGEESPPDLVTACLRPLMPDGLPVIGRLVNVDGEELMNVYVNAGHNCWGILWSGVSGKAMAELVMEGEAKCMNLKPFFPKRLICKMKSR